MLRTALALIRLPCIAIGVALAVTSPLHHTVWLAGLGTGAILVGVATACLPARRVDREPVTVGTPVRGRWKALNSPADRVPSHGVHSNGQTYAIDLIHAPDADAPKAWLERWPLSRRPSAYPGFGEPVFAPVDGTVVRVRRRSRDHWSRTSRPALLYFWFVEGIVRDLIGSGALLGNHVVIDAGDDTYAVLAHLKRGSVIVAKGQRISAGERLGACGNSGNTTEPHLHFQLMDRPWAAVAAGVPFRFAGQATPKNGEPLNA